MYYIIIIYIYIYIYVYIHVHVYYIHCIYNYVDRGIQYNHRSFLVLNIINLVMLEENSA